MHHIVNVGSLVRIKLRIGYRRNQSVQIAPDGVALDLDRVTFGYALATLPDDRAQCRIIEFQLVNRYTQRLRQGVGLNVGLQLKLLIVRRWIQMENAEQCLCLTLDIKHGKELRVEVARCKSKRPPLVVGNDGRYVIGAGFADCPGQTTGTMVVGCQREGPAAE